MELKDGVMHSDIQTRVSGDWEMEEGMRSSNSDQRCLCGHVKYLHTPRGHCVGDHMCCQCNKYEEKAASRKPRTIALLNQPTATEPKS